MFQSSGYFKAITCPFFASGLCERPYCHFRHVRSAQDEQLSTSLWSSTVASSAGSAQGTGSSLLAKVGETIQKLQRDIERDQQLLNGHKGVKPKSIGAFAGSVVEKYRSRVTLGDANKTPPKTEETAAEFSYEPTPISELKKKRESEEKYKINDSESDAKNEDEYEPTAKKPRLHDEPMEKFSDQGSQDSDEEPGALFFGTTKSPEKKVEKVEEVPPLPPPPAPGDILSRIMQDSNKSFDLANVKHKKDGSMVILEEKKKKKKRKIVEKYPTAAELDLEMSDEDIEDAESSMAVGEANVDEGLEEAVKVKEPVKPVKETEPSNDELEMAKKRESVWEMINSGAIVLGSMAKKGASPRSKSPKGKIETSSSEKKKKSEREKDGEMKEPVSKKVECRKSEKYLSEVSPDVKGEKEANDKSAEKSEVNSAESDVEQVDETSDSSDSDGRSKHKKKRRKKRKKKHRKKKKKRKKKKHRHSRDSVDRREKSHKKKSKKRRHSSSSSSSSSSPSSSSDESSDEAPEKDTSSKSSSPRAGDGHASPKGKKDLNKSSEKIKVESTAVPVPSVKPVDAKSSPRKSPGHSKKESAAKEVPLKKAVSEALGKVTSSKEPAKKVDGLKSPPTKSRLERKAKSSRDSSRPRTSSSTSSTKRSSTDEKPPAKPDSDKTPKVKADKAVKVAGEFDLFSALPVNEPSFSSDSESDDIVLLSTSMDKNESLDKSKKLAKKAAASPAKASVLQKTVDKSVSELDLPSFTSFLDNASSVSSPLKKRHESGKSVSERKRSTDVSNSSEKSALEKDSLKSWSEHKAKHEQHKAGNSLKRKHEHATDTERKSEHSNVKSEHRTESKSTHRTERKPEHRSHHTEHRAHKSERRSGEKPSEHESTKIADHKSDHKNEQRKPHSTEHKSAEQKVKEHRGHHASSSDKQKAHERSRSDRHHSSHSRSHARPSGESRSSSDHRAKNEVKSTPEQGNKLSLQQYASKRTSEAASMHERRSSEPVQKLARKLSTDMAKKGSPRQAPSAQRKSPAQIATLFGESSSDEDVKPSTSKAKSPVYFPSPIRVGQKEDVTESAMVDAADVDWDDDPFEVDHGDVYPKKEKYTIPTNKKRIAHPEASRAPVRIGLPMQKTFLSPAEQMHNRFKLIQQRKTEAANATPKYERNEFESLSAPNKGRVAHSAKWKKEEPTPIKTSAFGKRVAHVPAKKVLSRPIIPNEFGSRVPTSIRQKYLNQLIDECLTIYNDQQAAFDRALHEEKTIYGKSSSRVVYMNVAAKAVRILRAEIANQAGTSSKKQVSRTWSHEAVLGGAKAAKTTFTLHRSGHGHIKAQGEVELTLGLFSKYLQQYILTVDQLKENGFPMADPENPNLVKFFKETDAKPTKGLKLHEKICCRCGKKFRIYPDGTYATNEECCYHWARAYKRKVSGQWDSRYNCCGGDLSSEPCCSGTHHVHETNKATDLEGYVKTFARPPTSDGYGVYALDCEMVYTVDGCELARVTVIDMDMEPVYETLVKPNSDVIDYNTRFSGLEDGSLDDVGTTIHDVQNDLRRMFSEKTIVMGHSLESDFVALKFVHPTVVDTSVVFPHRLGPPYKRALRNLMADIMKKIIQNDVGGHDSKEDAAACMELMVWKVKEELRVKH